jgi:hypothetical protein
MHQPKHAREFALLEEALTVLFCLVEVSGDHRHWRQGQGGQRSGERLQVGLACAPAPSPLTYSKWWRLTRLAQRARFGDPSACSCPYSRTSWNRRSRKLAKIHREFIAPH